MSLPAAVYRPRNPQLSDYYRCVEDYFETFVQIYDEHFSRQYSFWRPYVEQVIYRYLDCGDLHNGFARVKCKDCGHEYLLAWLFLQAPTFLPFLSSKARRGIRRVALLRCPEKGASPAFCLQHPEDPPPLLSLRPEASCRLKPLCLGIPEGLYPGNSPGSRSHPWRGHRHPDLRRFPGIQPPLPYLGYRWLLLRQQGHVPRRPAPGVEKAGEHLPT